MGDNSFAGINFDDNESKQIFETHQQTLCDEYKVINDSTFTVNLKITKYNGAYILDGTYQGYSMEQLFVKYSAASPPTLIVIFQGAGYHFQLKILHLIILLIRELQRLLMENFHSP